jgi:hypothetical protein
MRDPVATKYGHLFERAALEDALRRNGGECPLTRRPLGPQDYFPALAVKNAIEEYQR